jgi:glycosyltransferase involved in cell wall biosynthesis
LRYSADGNGLDTGTKVALLTGGGDKPYAFGITKALSSAGITIDFIGSNDLDTPDFPNDRKVKFLNLRGDQSELAPFRAKTYRILAYYLRLMQYALVSQAKVFHILWNNRFQLFDRTLLMLYYKVTGKKIVFTAHNVNVARRDGTDSFVNRVSLRIQYRLADHIFVHTEKMKKELLADFGVLERRVTVIPFGINDVAPNTTLTPEQARKRVGVGPNEKTILFFGRIGPYKGLDLLCDAFEQLASKDSNYRLLIVGNPKKGAENYCREVVGKAQNSKAGDRITARIEFIPDEDTELYFKSSDVVLLPYTESFQSGVLFLAYSFGLPVIATDVGSFREDIIVGRTGLVCEPSNISALAGVIEQYFQSDMYKSLDNRREDIQNYARSKYSWEIVSQMTRKVYLDLEGQIQA